MSAYRSELPRLERRLHELEVELAELGEDDDAPLARDRQRRDARMRLLTGLFVIVAGPIGAVGLGSVLGSSVRPAPSPPAVTDDALARAAEARRATCNRAAHIVEADLHACEVALGDALDGRGVAVDGPDDSALASELVPRAASVLTCLSGHAHVRLAFGDDGELVSLGFDRADRLASAEQSCVRAALQPVTGPAGASMSATFGAGSGD